MMVRAKAFRMMVAGFLMAIGVAGCSQRGEEREKVAEHPEMSPGAEFDATRPVFHEGSEARHERFNAISREGSARLVFLGDSITEGWEDEGKVAWERFYGPATGRHAVNFGIGGDRTEHVLWRLEHGNFDGLSPKLIAVMIGTNNAGHRRDPARETEAGVRKIVSTLLAKCPESKILLLGIFPRGDRLGDPCRVLNDQVNAGLRDAYQGDPRVRYRDIGGIFVDADGVPRRDLMPDLLHLSPEAYGMWAKEIESDVEWGMAR